MAGISEWPRAIGPAPDNQVIMIIRHAEKPKRSRPALAITPEGEHSKHSLTVAGWMRAGALAGLFAPHGAEPPAGLCRPDAVYGPAYEPGRSVRSVQTVTPVAARLGLDVVTSYAAGEEAYLADELRARPGVTLVAWKHSAISKIAEYLGDVTPTPPLRWPGSRYDIVWTFTRNGSGWRFEQIPQMLLPGDLPYPITDPALVAAAA
jgi:hypothetical protein